MKLKMTRRILIAMHRSGIRYSLQEWRELGKIIDEKFRTADEETRKYWQVG